MRTFGEIIFEDNKWKITNLEPHVRIKLKNVFRKIGLTATPPYAFEGTLENCADLLWFTQRYPLKIEDKLLKKLKRHSNTFYKEWSENEGFLTPDYVPEKITFKDGLFARDYQTKFAELSWRVKRLICGDELGIGKTITAITFLTNPKTLPALVVVPSHLPSHWYQKIYEFTNLRTHIIKGRKPYSLPIADVYIIKYTCLSGWTDYFSKRFLKTAIFDEIQELRRRESLKYESADCIVNKCGVEYCMGLTATPIYNYADEMWNILNVVKPNCLGNIYEFTREWGRSYGTNRVVVNDPVALGTYLREQYLFVRRTRKEVGRELPPVNKIIHYVDYDEAQVKKSYDIARALSIKVTSGTFTERGQASRELDMLARHTTGVSKAKYVAEYVEVLLSNNRPVLLSGWHRDVYDIWKVLLEHHNPAWFTGSESPKQKEEAKRAFIAGETNLMIISNRSGIGLDGLQGVCDTVVLGELDWSPKVHEQLIGRIDRDGQKNQVTAIFLVSDTGSDIPIIEMLGLKSSQAHGIVDPLKGVEIKHSDDSRIRRLAQQYLTKKELSENKQTQLEL